MPANLAIMARETVAIGPTGRRLAANVLALRKRRGLNQPQLARRMQEQGRQVHATVVSKIEQLDRRVDVDDLVALAIALDVTPNRLLLTSATDTDRVELTPLLSLFATDALRWANGRHPLGWPPNPDRDGDATDFLREHDPDYDGRLRGASANVASRVLDSLMAAIGRGLTPDVLHQLVDVAAGAAVTADRPPEQPLSTVEGNLMTESASKPEPQPVATAIVTSSRGVLVGKRNDGKPPWTFIAGEVEPGETAPFAAVREVKEETGLEARARHEIGRRVHPKTGRTMIYIAAEPVRPGDLGVIVGDSQELAEVRWVSLPEADELMAGYGMFGPVREYLAREIGEA